MIDPTSPSVCTQLRTKVTTLYPDPSLHSCTTSLPRLLSFAWVRLLPVRRRDLGLPVVTSDSIFLDLSDPFPLFLRLCRIFSLYGRGLGLKRSLTIVTGTDKIVTVVRPLILIHPVQTLRSNHVDSPLTLPDPTSPTTSLRYVDNIVRRNEGKIQNP